MTKKCFLSMSDDKRLSDNTTSSRWITFRKTRLRTCHQMWPGARAHRRQQSHVSIKSAKCPAGASLCRDPLLLPGMVWAGSLVTKTPVWYQCTWGLSPWLPPPAPAPGWFSPPSMGLGVVSPLASVPVSQGLQVPRPPAVRAQLCLAEVSKGAPPHTV